MRKSGDGHLSLTHTLLCLLMMLVATAASAQPQSPTPPVQPPPASAASVNTVDIMVSQLEAAVSQMHSGPALKLLIDRELVRQEAASKGVTLSEESLQKYIQGAEATVPPGRRAGRLGFSSETYRTQMAFGALLDLLTERFRQEQVLSQARAYYTAHQSSFSAGPRVHVFEMVTDDIRMAYLAVERIKSGEEFTTVAAKLSVDDQEAAGDLGWMAPEDYHMAEHLAQMQVGEVSAPIAEGERYFVVHLRNRAEDQSVEFEEVKNELTSLIAASARMSFTAEDYLELLARRARIEVTHQPLQFLNDYYRDLARIRVLVDGQDVKLPGPAVRLASGSMLIPLKAVLQALHATLTWDEPTRSLTARNHAGTVTVTAESASIEVGTVEPVEVDIGQAAELRDGLLYAPPREILDALGAAVEWDGVRNQLLITSPECPDLPAGPGGLQIER